MYLHKYNATKLDRFHKPYKWEKNGKTRRKTAERKKSLHLRIFLYKMEETDDLGRRQYEKSWIYRHR